MTDKQLAVYLQNIYRQLSEELETIQAVLETDTNYTEPYKGLFGNELTKIPILERLSDLVQNISLDIDDLKDENDNN